MRHTRPYLALYINLRLITTNKGFLASHNTDFGMSFLELEQEILIQIFLRDQDQRQIKHHALDLMDFHRGNFWQKRKKSLQQII